jgi:hypothetical protein
MTENEVYVIYALRIDPGGGRCADASPPAQDWLAWIPTSSTRAQSVPTKSAPFG